MVNLSGPTSRTSPSTNTPRNGTALNPQTLQKLALVAESGAYNPLPDRVHNLITSRQETAIGPDPRAAGAVFIDLGRD